MTVRAFPVCLLTFLAGTLLTTRVNSAPAASPGLHVEITPQASSPCLYENSGFERLNGIGFPDGWKWAKRNTNATCDLTFEHPHGGKQALRFTNGTAFGDNVFGVLFRPQVIPLQIGHTYTLSAWVRSFDPGKTFLGTWSDPALHLYLPNTNGEWKRISETFTAASIHQKFDLIFVLESPTDGFSLDDVKLEEGPEPTPEVDPAHVSLSEPPKAAILSDHHPFATEFLATSPSDRPDAELRLSFEPRHTTLVQPIHLPKGASRIRMTLDEPGWSGDQQVRMRICTPGEDLSEASFSLRFLSAPGLLARADELEHKVSTLLKRAETLEHSGLEVHPATISLAVCERFIPFLHQDVAAGELARATDEMSEVDSLVVEARQSLDRTDELRTPRLPVPVLSVRPRIQGSSFLFPVAGRSGARPWAPVIQVGYGHFGQIWTDIEKMPRLGVNLVEVEVGPKDVLPAPGRVDRGTIEKTLRLLERAHQAGVGVDLLISPHYMPEWMLKQHPELHRRREGFLQYCLHAASGRRYLRSYLQALLPPLRGQSALRSICLSNEPMNVEEPCPDASREWQQWLKARHGTLETLNARWDALYSGWDQISLPDPTVQANGAYPTPRWADWIRFNEDSFAAWHQLLRDEVRRALPGVPVHVKAMNWSLAHTTEVRYGLEPTSLSTVTDLNGQDSVTRYLESAGEFAQDWALSLLTCDLQRSVHDVPVFNSENHLLPDDAGHSIPREHVRSALWQAAVHGQSATTLWLWERSMDRRDASFWSYLQHPLCAAEVGRTCWDLNRLAAPVTALQRAAPDVLLFEGTSTKVWDGGAPQDCTEQLYIALTFLGVRVGFVTERQLEAGHIPSTSVLFLPNVTHVSREALQTLAHCRSQIICVGDAVPTRDEYNRPAQTKLPHIHLDWDPLRQNSRELWKALPAVLAHCGHAPALSLTDGEGAPAWGIAISRASTAKGQLVNLCNYRSDTVRVRLSTHGTPSAGLDLLNGRRTGDTIELAPLQVRLIQLPSH